MTSTNTSITDELSTLRKSQAQLRSMMQNLMSRLDTSLAAPLPPAPLPTQTTMPFPSAGMFVPPVPGAGINGASSAASLSLHSQFSNVNPAVIVAIITHEFKATDLHKLDLTNRDKEMAYTFNGSTNQFKISTQAAREFKTPFLVIIPLQSYFDILAFHVNNTVAMSAFF